MLLYRLHRIALRLLPFRSFSLWLALAGVFLAAFALLTALSTPSLFLSSALVLTLWALMLFSFIQLFQQIPAPVLPGDRLLERMRSRIKLGLYHLLALAVVILGAALLSMSLKLLLLR